MSAIDRSSVEKTSDAPGNTANVVQIPATEGCNASDYYFDDQGKLLKTVQHGTPETDGCIVRENFFDDQGRLVKTVQNTTLETNGCIVTEYSLAW